jgi:iron complex transport system substrate-binding protein
MKQIIEHIRSIISLVLILSLFMVSSSAFAEMPKRIVSLAPNITEILFNMNLGDRVVAVSSFCDYPEEAKKKPKVGGMSNPSLEAVTALRPDLVILTTDGNPREFEKKLRSLKIKTYVVRTRNISELPQGIRELGSALGARDRADILAKKIEDAVHGFSRSASPKKSVLFIIWPEPLIVAGPGSAIDDVINLLGHANIASQAKVSYPKYSVEEIIRQSPDVIVIGKGHADTKEMSAGLLKKISRIPAVRGGKVCFLSDHLYRLGPRIIEGIEEIAECLR